MCWAKKTAKVLVTPRRRISQLKTKRGLANGFQCGTALTGYHKRIFVLILLFCCLTFHKWGEHGRISKPANHLAGICRPKRKRLAATVAPYGVDGETAMAR